MIANDRLRERNRRRRRIRINMALFRRQTKFGPIWLNAPGLIVPYGVGIAIQRALFSRQWVQQKFFAPQIVVLQNLFALMGREVDAETILEHLMGNYWTMWRYYSLQDAQTAARWLQVRGAEHLRAAYVAGCGVVLAEWHTPMTLTVWDWMHAQGKPPFSIRVGNLRNADSQVLVKHWVTQLVRAGEVLEEGGTVVVAVDGTYGAGGTSVELVKGRQKEFSHGAAQLAIDHNAHLIPVQTGMGTDGVAWIEFMPRLLPAPDADDPVAALMAAYAVHYRQRWPHEIQYVAAYQLKAMLDQVGDTSRIESSNQRE